jgi:hypothetical protein
MANGEGTRTMLKSLFLSINLLCSTVEISFGQTVFAVLVGDTNDGQLGPGVQANITGVKNLLSQIKTEAGINVVIEPDVKGDDFGCAKIREAVNNVPWTPRDAVLFWYSGHGDRSHSDTKIFPMLNCLRHREDTETETDDIVSQVLNPGPTRRPPRLFITIIDACNKSFGESPAIVANEPNVEARKDAFRKLLLNYAGAIVSSSSVQNQYSYYYGDNSGGYFTKQFLRTINDVSIARGTGVSWDQVLAAATKQILVPDSTQGSQQPQFREFFLQEIP